MSRCTAPVTGRHSKESARLTCPACGVSSNAPQAAAAVMPVSSHSPRQRLQAVVDTGLDELTRAKDSSDIYGGVPVDAAGHFVQAHVSLTLRAAAAICPQVTRVRWDLAHDADSPADALLGPEVECPHHGMGGPFYDFARAHGTDDCGLEDELIWTPRGHEMDAHAKSLGVTDAIDAFVVTREAWIGRMTGLDPDNAEAIAMFSDVDPGTLSAEDDAVELARTMSPDPR